MTEIYTKEALRRLANELAATLKGHENIYLSGELGSGKTTFTSHLVTALDKEAPAVTSPTFQLIHEYNLKDGRRLLHIDLYRLEHPDDVLTLGLLDWLADRNTICVVEWPERGEGVLPPPAISLHFRHRSPTTRHLQVKR